MRIISNPVTPFWTHLEGDVRPGLTIYVTGHIPHHSDRFEINLVEGSDTGHHAAHHSSIALHVNPRVHEDYVVLNSRHHKSWGSEERHTHTHQLHRGNNFSIAIHVEHEYYRVEVNGVPLAYFHHRMPYQCVGALFIDGDVDIHNVEIKHGGGGYGGEGMPYVVGGGDESYIPGQYVESHHHHHDSHHHHHHHGHHDY
ncbi:galectin-7-like [Oppia nitens]|uniref:galectin-7-like n=1 Tax=Oppia nitens TaxID=1686743 RepID=UPI0023DAFA88|nr:galectin-7-like [Oppia nitens]